MATHPALTDLYDDTDFVSLPRRSALRHTTSDLELKVRSLKAEVEMLQQCLHDCLDLQKNILDRWDQDDKVGARAHPAQPINPIPVAASTPYVPNLSNRRPEYPGVATPSQTQTATTASRFQSDPLELSNTTRVLAAALQQAKLEPPVFTDDGVIHPEDWLQSVNTYRSSLDLTDAQILRAATLPS